MKVALYNGRIVDKDDYVLTDKIIEARRNKNIWDVIDLLLKVWAKKAPNEVKAMKVQIADYKSDLIDKKFGQTKGGKQIERRFTLAFPQQLMFLIRKVYPVQELPMDKRFFATFAKKYPFFQIPEHL